MARQDFTEINWTAALFGFGADFVFSELVGFVVLVVILSLKGISLDAEDAIPSDAQLAIQIVGVVGAIVGGVVAGYIARRRGTLHGVLASVIGLIVFFCSIPILGNPTLSIGDLGFIVLNLIAAGYGGGLGQRWRARRESNPGDNG